MDKEKQIIFIDEETLMPEELEEGDSYGSEDE